MEVDESKPIVEATEKQKPMDNKGLECFVIDEYLIADEKLTVNKTNTTETGQKEKKKDGKKRQVYRFKDKGKLCSAYVDMAEGSGDPVCTFTNCKYTHDVASYMASKPPDIGPACYNYETFGHCPRGLTCRWAKPHTDEHFKNKKNLDIYTGESKEKNHVRKGLQISLRKKEFDFKAADDACNIAFDILREREAKEKQANNNHIKSNIGKIEESSEQPDTDMNGESKDVNNGANDSEPCEKKPKLDGAETNGGRVCDNGVSDKELHHSDEPKIGCVSDEDLIKLRPKEKKKLDWKDKLYLAPLTTVGNLPFRRLCKKLGADITCSEMAVAVPLLQGHAAEWALLKRHESENFFGVQVCGCSPPQMSRIAQLLEETVDCDFVDINMGCPIDLIFKKGMGSGLMIRNRPVEIIARTMASLMTRQLTIKMRTGVYKDKNVAHNLFPKLEGLGVSALTIHGRSREQRYTKLADWDYISECKRTVQIPVFGNGDILNYEDYYARKEESGVDGIMLARGALIKPWLFTEIKERRHWDITSSERLDIIKDYANFGLEHWGSDDKGLETTRKFLLEWLSFNYRYVPHGIVKYPPQRINERVPVYRGRNEMETLLSSPNAQDWVKITELFLGKVKDDFHFSPRHKANSYS